MNRCTDTKLGGLLHSFELGILADEDKERFAAHVLECAYCHERLISQQAAIDLLRHDPDVRNDVQSAASESVSPEIDTIPWYRALIATPIIRYAAAAVLVLAVGLPLYRTLQDGEDSLQVLQTVTLSATRTAGDNVVRLGRGDAVEILFALPGADKQSIADVRLVSSTGQEAVVLERFDSFDSGGMGRLIVPLDKLAEGIYQLKIRDQRQPTDSVPRTYVLLVKRAVDE